jgi:hypothetical protein
MKVVVSFTPWPLYPRKEHLVPAGQEAMNLLNEGQTALNTCVFKWPCHTVHITKLALRFTVAKRRYGGTSDGSCEHGNETLGSIKGGEFID